MGHSQLGCSVRYSGHKMLVKCQGLLSWESSKIGNYYSAGILYGDSIIWPIKCLGLGSQTWLVECFGSLLAGRVLWVTLERALRLGE